jgi:hypothetical protein
MAKRGEVGWARQRMKDEGGRMKPAPLARYLIGEDNLLDEKTFEGLASSKV